jgi:hypothetical protein
MQRVTFRYVGPITGLRAALRAFFSVELNHKAN